MTQRGQAIRSGYPLGVIVVIVINVLRCVTIGLGLADVSGSPLADWLRANSPMPEFTHGSDIEIVVEVFMAGVLVSSVLVVIGLLARRRWAWVLAIVSAGVVLAINLAWWFDGEARYASMLLNVIAVFYLNQRDVRLALRGGGAPE